MAVRDAAACRALAECRATPHPARKLATLSPKGRGDAFADAVRSHEFSESA